MEPLHADFEVLELAEVEGRVRVDERVLQVHGVVVGRVDFEDGEGEDWPES